MNPITYVRNTTLPITFIYEKNGVPSTDGVSLYFTVKAAPGYDSSATDTTAIVSKKVSMASSSTVSFTIDPPDVADTVAPGKNYVYDFKMQETGTNPIVIYPAGNGQFILEALPTNRES